MFDKIRGDENRLENNHQLNVDCLTNVYILVCVMTEKRDYSYLIFGLENCIIFIFSELYG